MMDWDCQTIFNHTLPETIFDRCILIQTKAPAFALGQFAQTRLRSDGSLCNIELPSVDWVAQSELSVAKHWTAGQSCSVQTASVGPTATGFSGCWPCRAPRKRGKDNVSGVKHSPLERFQSSDKWSLSSWLRNRRHTANSCKLSKSLLCCGMWQGPMIYTILYL